MKRLLPWVSVMSDRQTRRLAIFIGVASAGCLGLLIAVILINTVHAWILATVTAAITAAAALLITNTLTRASKRGRELIFGSNPPLTFTIQNGLQGINQTAFSVLMSPINFPDSEDISVDFRFGIPYSVYLQGTSEDVVIIESIALVICDRWKVPIIHPQVRCTEMAPRYYVLDLRKDKPEFSRNWLPLTVSNKDAELFRFYAITRSGEGASWYLVASWICQGKRGILRIDNDGVPFETVTNSPESLWSYPDICSPNCG